ncbi:MAG: transposase family protein [Treponema sp.]|nr:transposase family protein [Treponema sp.]
MDRGKLKKTGKESLSPAAMGNLRHKLEDILVIGRTTLIYAGEDFEDREAFGWERALKQFLELPEGEDSLSIVP